MAKLKPKKWMTISEAAGYLTDMSDGAPVTEADVIQFAVDDYIKLALRTTNDTARPILFSEIFPKDEVEEEKVDEEGSKEKLREPTTHEIMVMFNLIDGEVFLGTDPRLEVMWPNLWELDNWGSAEFILNLWRKLQDPEISHNNKLGPQEPILYRDGGQTVRFGQIIKLHDENHTMTFLLPDHLIPEESFLVVRFAELQKLIEDEAPTAPATKDLSTREKRTYLRTIRALCEDHKDIDLTTHSTAANQIIAIADSFGLSIPGQRTLEVLLKEARDLED